MTDLTCRDCNKVDKKERKCVKYKTKLETSGFLDFIKCFVCRNNKENK